MHRRWERWLGLGIEVGTLGYNAVKDGRLQCINFRAQEKQRGEGDSAADAAQEQGHDAGTHGARERRTKRKNSENRMPLVKKQEQNPYRSDAAVQTPIDQENQHMECRVQGDAAHSAGAQIRTSP
jgi:hypothetical protein